MALALQRLPRFLILEPVSTVRLEMELSRPSCEIDVELQNPEPGRAFVLTIGKKDGPYLQRMTLSGRARIHFDPQAPGIYVLVLANPQKEPLVLRLKARNLPQKRARSSRRRPSTSTAAKGRRRAVPTPDGTRDPALVRRAGRRTGPARRSP